MDSRAISPKFLASCIYICVCVFFIVFCFSVLQGRPKSVALLFFALPISPEPETETSSLARPLLKPSCGGITEVC